MQQKWLQYVWPCFVATPMGLIAPRIAMSMLQRLDEAENSNSENSDPACEERKRIIGELCGHMAVADQCFLSASTERTRTFVRNLQEAFRQGSAGMKAELELLSVRADVAWTGGDAQ
jgi:hypothetical protein